MFSRTIKEANIELKRQEGRGAPPARPEDRGQMIRCFRNSRGTILPMAVLLLTAIITATAFAVDLSYYGNVRSALEKATEAASVAGAQEYFRSQADAGMAIDEALRVYKMNISTETMIGMMHNPTGMGQPSTLTYSTTFTTADGLSQIFRDQPVMVTITTELARGKVTVISETSAKPYFAQMFTGNTTIKVTKVSELPPYDVVFVNDLSGSMRFATVNTYIGSASVRMIGQPLILGMVYPDVVLYQSQSQSWGFGSEITANGLVTRIIAITDIVINTPGFDIPGNATYTNGRPVYINNPDRGFIVNTDRSIGLRRTAITGYRVSELMSLPISPEDQNLVQTYDDNRSQTISDVERYFNRAANFIEPHASAVFGVMSFVDTVRIYGSAALKLGLVTFESSSYLNDRTSDYLSPELRANALPKRQRRVAPYVDLTGPSGFNIIVDKLTIKSSSGNGSVAAPLMTTSYPDGGTNINAGLNNAKTTLDRSDRPSSEKIIILFTDGEPTSHSFSALGTKVKELTNAGIKLYSIVLTLAVSQSSIDQFRYQIEQVGRGEPVIFISDPARLRDAFLQIADELGLKLVN